MREKTGRVLQFVDDLWQGRFQAMGGPCEILVRLKKNQKSIARHCLDQVADEALRIEQKYSRYIAGNIVDLINRAGEAAVQLDEETARLLDFADQLHQLSDGRFDITSGVLRNAWTFDGSDQIPSAATIANALKFVGWQKVERNSTSIRLTPGMQIDFGGIGKEYAVDRTTSILAKSCEAPGIVNFGGDLSLTTSSANTDPWRIGIESPTEDDNEPERVIHISCGALATSGDARRFLLHKGKRYSHLLDCRTGWPIKRGPRSVTVAADTCIQAGMLSTLAMLHGPDAEAFLASTDTRYWILGAPG